ncbi:MAG: YkgJ family cysteine cluster protein [Acidobacteria bacterium]|nr:YkgJ family cysteine cluster protein [Acidobacteriota bacterium]
MKDWIENWKRNAARMEDETYNFLTRLKQYRDSDRIDRIAGEVHREVFSQIDCTDCGHCCRTVRPEVDQTDIARIAAFLGISAPEFTEKYLRSGDRDELEMKSLPCPFLVGNECSIYDVRPALCREYPHTDKPEFTTRRFTHIANTQVCPAVYHIIQKLKNRIGRHERRP